MTSKPELWWQQEPYTVEVFNDDSSWYKDEYDIPAIIARVRLDERLTCTEDVQKIIHEELRKTEKKIPFVEWRMYDKAVAQFALNVENSVLSRLSSIQNGDDMK